MTLIFSLRRPVWKRSQPLTTRSAHAGPRGEPHPRWLPGVSLQPPAQEVLWAGSRGPSTQTGGTHVLHGPCCPGTPSEGRLGTWARSAVGMEGEQAGRAPHAAPGRHSPGCASICPLCRVHTPCRAHGHPAPHGSARAAPCPSRPLHQPGRLGEGSAGRGRGVTSESPSPCPGTKRSCTPAPLCGDNNKHKATTTSKCTLSSKQPTGRLPRCPLTRAQPVPALSRLQGAICPFLSSACVGGPSEGRPCMFGKAGGDTAECAHAHTRAHTHLHTFKNMHTQAHTQSHTCTQ